ncbi:hypothetical protein MJI37_32160, partial [Salmonella enterica subsp. enterica serovar Cerro]|nr:hypothetical protein [Salmonella enterica subsp. enterica serovar Cerro]
AIRQWITVALSAKYYAVGWVALWVCTLLFCSLALRHPLSQLRWQAYTAGPLRLTVFGEMRTGSFVEMGNGVQLNPAHSRWLQGLP